MATNYAKASYTEVIDLQTVNGKTSIIGLHTPVGRRPYDRLHGFFNQFRKYRYKGISSLVMVPAANLPVDPLGLTGVQGTTDLMDPRDALNPILFHGCHGENLGPILNTIYSADERIGSTNNASAENYSDGGRNVSDSTSESLLTNSNIGAYYKCLTDVTWKKFGIQNGVKLKNLHPLVHKLARNSPMIPGLTSDRIDGNAGQLVEFNTDLTNGAQTPTYPPSRINKTDLTAPLNEVGDTWTMYGTGTTPVDPQYVQEFTNGMTRLGWMPTTKIATVDTLGNPNRQIATLPKLFMGVMILPPSYNIEQFMRCVIRHEFEFSGFTTSLGATADIGFGGQTNMTPSPTVPYFNWIDYGEEKIKTGETIDMINGETEVISDGVA